MPLVLKVLLPVLIFVGSVFAAKTVLENRPEPRKRPQFPRVQAVEATKLQPSDYPVVVRSQGTINPTQSSTLVAEVTGTVVELAENFVIGGSFAEGDVLMQIDERDYTIALTQARANLAQAQAALQEESARGKLAKEEWESLRRGTKASAFTLRQPQYAAARANRDAARAQVERAELDLERTRFVAPFDGRILEKNIDKGQFVSRGAKLGSIYSTNSVDVRLPLSSRQLTFIDVPSTGNVPTNLLPSIELKATIAGETQTWTGKLVRAEGVDTSTQQLNVIARVDDPFAPGKPPLRIGQYVEADIAGRVLEKVFVVPRAALREDREVLLVNGDGQLERRAVTVAWADEKTAAISDGLEEGVVLVTTALSTVTNGTPVRATIDGVAPPRRGGQGQGQRGQGQRGQGRPEGQAGQGQRGQGQRGQGRPEGQAGQGQRGQGQRGQGRPEGQAGQGQRGQGQRGQGRPEGQAGQGQRGQGQRGQGRPEGQAGQGQRGQGQRGQGRPEGQAGQIQRGQGQRGQGQSSQQNSN